MSGQSHGYFQWAFVANLRATRLTLVPETIGEYVVFVVNECAEWIAKAARTTNHLCELMSRSSCISRLIYTHYIVQTHPYWALFISALVAFGPPIIILPLILAQECFFAILSFVGFGLHGISKGNLAFVCLNVRYVCWHISIHPGSAAAYYQSRTYGGDTLRGSYFALLQSSAAAYNRLTLLAWYCICTRLVAFAVCIYVVAGLLAWCYNVRR